MKSDNAQDILLVTLLLLSTLTQSVTPPTLLSSFTYKPSGTDYILGHSERGKAK